MVKQSALAGFLATRLKNESHIVIVGMQVAITCCLSPLFMWTDYTQALSQILWRDSVESDHGLWPLLRQGVRWKPRSIVWYCLKHEETKQVWEPLILNSAICNLKDRISIWTSISSLTIDPHRGSWPINWNYYEDLWSSENTCKLAKLVRIAPKPASHVRARTVCPAERESFTLRGILVKELYRS